MIKIQTCSGVHEYKKIRSEALLSDPDAFGEVYENFILRSDTDIEIYLRDVNNGTSKRIDLMHCDEEIIGMCGYGINEGGLGFIWGVFIRNAFRGSGLAVELLNTSINSIWVMGGREIKARVAAPNMRAINFYKKLGFHISGPVGKLRTGSAIPVYEISISAQQGEAPEPASPAR